MALSDVIQLTRDLIGLNTINPPGNEAGAALLIGNILKGKGFAVDYVPYEEGRLHLVATRGCSKDSASVVLSGHLDTVPLGAVGWQVDPFAGEIKEGKLFGRGSSDMKGGVAAMVIASIKAFDEGDPPGGVQLILTAGEETGCQGAEHLVAAYKGIGSARGIIVGEPTSNIPAIGHKGGLYLTLSTTGKTAHSSMPHLGDNAIYKAARAIVKIEEFEFGEEIDLLLGYSTLNVGKITGGINLNSVPDHAEFTIDARTTANIRHSALIRRLKAELGQDVTIEVLVDLPAVSSKDDDPFVQSVYEACGIEKGEPGFPKSLPYLTDGAVLQSAFGGVPVIILGPGQPDMAHQTDEYCFIENIEMAVEIYKKIILKEKV